MTEHWRSSCHGGDTVESRYLAYALSWWYLEHILCLEPETHTTEHSWSSWHLDDAVSSWYLSHALSLRYLKHILSHTYYLALLEFVTFRWRIGFVIFSWRVEFAVLDTYSDVQITEHFVVARPNYWAIQIHTHTLSILFVCQNVFFWHTNYWAFFRGQTRICKLNKDNIYI